jgi:hypothetical protein
MSKKLIIALIISIFFVLSAEATTVSFVVIETGVPQEGRSHYSERWENALLDVFFDAGYIVCNAPIMRLDSKPSASKMQDYIQADLEDAREGGADFLIIAQLDFSANPAPQEISFIMYRVTPSSKIHESRVTGKTFRTDKEAEDELKTVAKGLVPHLRAN